MYSVVQRLNVVTGAIGTLSSQVRSLHEQVVKLTAEVDNVGQSPPVTIVEPSVRPEELADVKRFATKVQNDLKEVISELKKELDTLRKDDIKKEVSKETKLLEATLMLKVEQTINKMVKDRTETIGNELKSHVEKTLHDSIIFKSTSHAEPTGAEPVEISAPGEINSDEYEINVTLAGEKDDVQPKKRAGRPRKDAQGHVVLH